MDSFRGLFDKLDRDNDGFISREELLSEMRRIGVEPVCEKVQVRFSTSINCRDHVKESFFYVAYLEIFLCEQINSHNSVVQEILSNYDQNEDGRLSYQEFLIYIMDREKKWKIDFHALDRNKCGKLSVTIAHYSYFYRNKQLTVGLYCYVLSTTIQNKVL